MNAAQAALWKNLARRRGLLEEYRGRPFEVKYFGVHFRLREQPTDEDRVLLYNMAAAIRERINGRPFINARDFIERRGRLPNFGIFRRSGAVLINGHLAAQVIRGLMKLAEEGFIPPVKVGDRQPDPYDAERWRRILGGDGYIKVELLWARVPEGSYPGARIVFSGRERMAVWRITYDDRCVLVVFRNWVNPIHASRLMMDAAALASLAERHSQYYPWVRAIIVSTKPESAEAASTIMDAFKFKSLAAAEYNPYLAPPTLRNPQPSSEETLWFPAMLPRDVGVLLFPAAEYTHPKEAYAWIERKTPIELSQAYGEKEELSEYSLELILNAMLQALALRVKVIEKVRDAALNLGGAELLAQVMAKYFNEATKYTRGKPAEATRMKALLEALRQLERMQKEREKSLKKAQKTKTKNKQNAHNILMYNFGENGEKGLNQAHRAEQAGCQYLGRPHSSALQAFRGRATWRLLHICNFFFIGFIRGEGWVQPGPFKAKVRVYEKALSRNYKPYKKQIHYQYIMFTDLLGGRYWFPVSCVTSAERSLFSRSLEKIVEDYWRILDLDDKLTEFSRPLLKIMVLAELIRAAGRVNARKHRRLVRGFIGLASYWLSILVGGLFSRLAEVGVPDEPWARRLFIMRLAEWLDSGMDRSVRDALYMYRYRGFIEDELRALLSDAERRGDLLPGAPIVDPDLPPDNYKTYRLHERWRFWMSYVKKAAEKWDNPDLDQPLPDDEPS